MLKSFNRFFKGNSGGFALVELSDNDGKLSFIDDDGRHVYRTKINGRTRRHGRFEGGRREHTTLLKNFFINDKDTDIVNVFWKWFSPVGLR